MNLLRNLWHDESGQGLTEYGLIVALVSTGLIALIVAFRTQLSTLFNQIMAALTTAQ